MRKIETKTERLKRQRRNQITVGIILVAIMILSTAGYSIMDRSKTEESTVNYNNFEFVQTQGVWQLQKQAFALATRYLPKDVENVSYDGAFSADSFKDKEIYFVAFSDDARIAANEIARNLPVFRAQLACLEEDENRTECQDLPVKTCSSLIVVFDEKRLNATEFIHTKVYQEENCIIIESSVQNIIKAADRLLFAVYGIMS